MMEAEASSLARQTLPLGGIRGNHSAVERPLPFRFLPQRDDTPDTLGGQRYERVVVERRLLAARDPSGLEPSEVADAAKLPYLNHFGPPPGSISPRLCPERRRRRVRSGRRPGRTPRCGRD